MGRTLPSATQIIINEEASFGRFRRALRRSDQLALDDLFSNARQHTAAAQYAAHALPFEVFMLAMLLEEHKEVMHLKEKIAALDTPRRNIGARTEKASPLNLDVSRFIDPGIGFNDDPKPDQRGGQ